MKKLQILGTGCPKCLKLAAETKAAADALGIEYTLDKVTDLREIMKFRVMMTPALVVDGVVRAAGRIPSAPEITTWLTTAAEKAEQR
jgi:small redox-active disulfide protein 2